VLGNALGTWGTFGEPDRKAFGELDGNIIEFFFFTFYFETNGETNLQRLKTQILSKSIYMILST
jgi:hypothetical protein